jgi:hypothetical protein
MACTHEGVLYLDRVAADRARRILRRGGGPHLEYFPCDDGPGFHLRKTLSGSKKRRLRAKRA